MWKNLDFGIYYQAGASTVIKNNILVENGVGVFPFIVGPASLGHGFDDKYADITNNIFVGKTSSFDESLDVIDSSDHNIQFSSTIRSAGSGSPCGKIAFQMATFSSSGNACPGKPCTGIKAYQAIRGVTRVDGKFLKLFFCSIWIICFVVLMHKIECVENTYLFKKNGTLFFFK